MLQKVTVNPMQLMQDLGENYQATPDYRRMHRRHRPFFHGWWIDEMLTSPRIQEALKVLKGPIVTKSKFEVVTEDSEMEEMIMEMIDRFFLLAAEPVLCALEYGFSANEFIYEPGAGSKDFELVDVNHYRSFDTKPCTDNQTGKFDGFWVQSIKKYIRRPKAFHFAHNRQYNKIFGRSALFGAFLPWIEEWAIGGLRDIRKLWFAKNCYNSGVLYHPPGSTMVNGQEYENSALAQEIANKMATGHITTIEIDHGSSVEVGGGGVKTRWFFEPGKVNNVPEGLLETIKDIRSEQLQGIGIMPEIIESAGEGFGSSTGRSIPADIYFTTLQTILNSLCWEMQRQYINPLLQINLGKDLNSLPKFKIKAFELGTETLIDETGELFESENPMQDKAEGEKRNAARDVQNDPSVQQTREKNQAKAEAKKKAKSGSAN
jgi:hypothetical protein